MALQTKSVLLVGMTGEGKSFIGNLLLDRKEFTASDDSSSVTQECSSASREVPKRGFKLNVIDAAGLFDTHKSQQDVYDALAQFAEMAPEGIHAILVVIPGGRYKKSVNDALVAVEIFFGEEVWGHCIVVYNKTNRKPDDLWHDTTVQNQADFIHKWQAQGAGICTMAVDNDDEEGPCPRVARDVDKLLEAIARRTEVYVPPDAIQAGPGGPESAGSSSGAAAHGDVDSSAASSQCAASGWAIDAAGVGGAHPGDPQPRQGGLPARPGSSCSTRAAGSGAAANLRRFPTVPRKWAGGRGGPGAAGETEAMDWGYTCGDCNVWRCRGGILGSLGRGGGGNMCWWSGRRRHP
mmetsp:Transcript_56818/g.151655  ORF Transcript_56818/g.151655 Transcript_56818/m.151655 type:complete len:350 (-) Transcript_56818:23-1072(-)